MFSADRQRCSCVRPTNFGSDVVPEVHKRRATSFDRGRTSWAPLTVAEAAESVKTPASRSNAGVAVITLIPCFAATARFSASKSDEDVRGQGRARVDHRHRRHDYSRRDQRSTATRNNGDRPPEFSRELALAATWPADPVAVFSWTLRKMGLHRVPERRTGRVPLYHAPTAAQLFSAPN